MALFRRSAVVLLALLVGLCGHPYGASRNPIRARHGIVGSANEAASRVGVAILQQGGNAVDAAIAVGFALAVTYPAAGNLGGGGFMVLRLADGRETTIDYRETAPSAASRDMFLDDAGAAVAERSRVGALAAGIPGSIAGLAYAHEKYGRLPWAALIAPAVTLARDGIEVDWELAKELAAKRTTLARFPASARVFLKADGTAPVAGDRLVQPDLARTLSTIAEQGPAVFYRGAIADQIVAEMARTGGLITKTDLAAYQAKERPPVAGTFRGCRIITIGPPSSGGVALLELLNVLEGYPLGEYGHNSSRAMHLMAEAERRVYADRSEWLGDPDFVEVPVSGLVSKRYAQHIREAIPETRATLSSDVKPGRPRDFEHSETTHYSVVDADGNAVATTTTLNGAFGSGQMVTGAGFLLNNEMDDFSAKPGTPNMFGLTGGDANAISPGKRMLSSMTPTIVAKDGRTLLVLGSPGGSRIITTVLQVVLNVLEFGMDVQEAVDAPRFHHQWQPDVIRVERQGFPADVVTALGAMGHTIQVQEDMGDVHAIMIDPTTGLRLGASDPRMDGRTIGY
jgi:gamma-glutamyltranspeptidase/glutathione hydrolase